MSYKALYNKYRPSTFEEVAGQKSIVKTLQNAINGDKIGHAYLFCGPRGTGKTSMARLFAKALNCEHGLGCQCNQCSNCVAINEGTHPDVIEIDAASNNGVEQVRDLIEKVRYSPIKGKKKIYIIDEVHMMTPGAFNALLKTLEEPPEFVVFILATTEPYKVLPTILSRCQRFDFGKISPEDIKAKLMWVLDKEMISYDEEALNAVVSLADGGMRDALSILDQVLAYSGDSFTERDVLTLFGLTSNAEKIHLLTLLSKGDVSGVLAKLENFVSSGIDIKRLCDNLVEILKDVVIYEKTKEVSLLTSIHADEAASLSSILPAEKANQMISILLKTQMDFKNVSNIRSLFELSLLQLASLKDEKAVQQPKIEVKPAVQQAPKPKIEPAPAAKPVEPKPKAEEAPKPAPTLPSIDFSGIDKANISDDGELNKLADETVIGIMVLGGNHKQERQKLYSQWGQIEAYKTHPTLGNLANLLSQGHPFCVCEEAVLLTFDHTRLRDKANIKANQKPIAAILSKMLGRQVFVYSLDRLDCNKYYGKFTSLSQINQLPKKEKIKLDLPKGE